MNTKVTLPRLLSGEVSWAEVALAAAVASIFLYWQYQHSELHAAEFATLLGLFIGYIALRVALNQLQSTVREVRSATARLSRQTALVSLQRAGEIARSIKESQNNAKWGEASEGYAALCENLAQLNDSALNLSEADSAIIEEAIAKAETIVLRLDRPNIDTVLTDDQKAELAAASLAIRINIARISARLKGVVE